MRGLGEVSSHGGRTAADGAREVERMAATRTRLLRAVAVWMGVVTLVAWAAATPATAATDTGFDQVVNGLSNPRGIAFGDNGALFVSEGGLAGAGPVSTCFPGQGTEEGGEACAGTSAQISRVDVAHHTVSAVVTGLPSFGDDTGFFSIGASGMAVQGNQVFGVLGGNPIAIPPVEACPGTTNPDACPGILAAAANFGGVVRVVPSGHATWQQNVGAFNYEWVVANKDTIDDTLPGWANNPDFQPGDANPYAATAAPGGIYVADGGSNTLTWVPDRGAPKVLAALPNGLGEGYPYDAVATCTAVVGNRVLIGDLNGRLYLYDGSTMFPQPLTLGGDFLVATGGCAADRSGNVYVSDIFGGQVLKLSLDTMTLTQIATGLSFPSGVAIGRDGAVYVANNGVCPAYLTGPIPGLCGGSGEIVRLHSR